MNRNSLHTRQTLAACLKQQLATTPLSKITVAQLVKQAGITRQAFYYHFHDIYELVEWVFTTEVADHIREHASLEEWYMGLEMLLDYFQRHQGEVLSVIRSINYRKLERFFYESFSEMMQVVVNDVIRRQSMRDPAFTPPRETDKDFVIQHFTSAVVGHTLHWITSGMKDDPHILVRRLECTMHGQVAIALERLKNFPL